MTEAQNLYRAEKIESMRKVLEFLEENPIIPLPWFGTFYSHPESDENLKDITRTMSPCDKEVSNSFYKLTREFGSVSLIAAFNREDVCEKKVVRTETVPAQLVPAFEREIVEWECPPSLLGRDDDA